MRDAADRIGCREQIKMKENERNYQERSKDNAFTRLKTRGILHKGNASR